MSNKFVREQHLVKLLMERVGVAPTQYLDPNAAAGRETGADVLAVVGDHRIGIQVTEVDTGDIPGRSRANEKKDSRDGEVRHGGVYGGWAQNDPNKTVTSLHNAIVKKVEIAEKHTFSDFTEVWLLVSCGVPEPGSVISTFIMTPWLDAETLNRATTAALVKSKYSRAFVHSILGTENALYHWTAEDQWQKVTQPDDPRGKGPSLWDIIAADPRRR